LKITWKEGRVLMRSNARQRNFRCWRIRRIESFGDRVIERLKVLGLKVLGSMIFQSPNHVIAQS
jgi:hypothetical protein